MTDLRGTDSTPRAWLPPTLVLGFAIAVALWVGAFLIHFPTRPATPPPTSAPGQVDQPAPRAPLLQPAQAGPILLALWLVSAAMAGRTLPRRQAPVIGLLSGLLTAGLSLLVLGSLLVSQPRGGTPAPGAGGLVPSAAAVAPAFLALGAVIGLVGAFIGSRTVPESRKGISPPWLARFAIVTVIAFVPLLLLGSLVTTTDSGMAIRGWPDSYGANMFLYPLSLMVSDHQRFLEHSHRLFGALVGLTTIAQLILVLSHRPRPAPPARTLALLLFILVCIQGGLGGARVLEDSRWMAAFHGVFAQLIFGLAVALAAILSPAYQETASVAPAAADRRTRFITTGLLHASILQLLLGAVYRHLRESHALWTHAAFSVVVLVFAILGGLLLAARRTDSPDLTRTLSRIGRTLTAVVILQFLLGWAALGVTGGKEHAAASLAETAVRTAHQANGALLLAMATLAFTWTRRLLRRYRPQATAPTPALE